MKSIKTLTMYLPQYHRTKENDEWWGEGFTDWTAVKNAEPIYEGHKQPKTPLGGRYYDLLDKETMLWQAQLMKDYGIDGQCIYHYYFKDRKKVLNEPIENLLKWKDVDMPFCLCWANFAWKRTWNTDAWADKFQTSNKEEILIEQKYGGEAEWEAHFQYLLPFFKDSRYIRNEGKPVFVIYAPNDIYCLEQMISLWKTRAIEEGLGGLYIILATDRYFEGADAIWRHTPHAFWKAYIDKERGGIRSFNYDELWASIIDESPHPGIKTFFEGMANCDDTPRRGRKGNVLQNYTIQKFQEGMIKLYKKSIELGNEFVFVNAWNEWGEGMYLEPDEEYGYQVLEALKNAQQSVSCINIQRTEQLCDCQQTIVQRELECRRKEKNYMLLDKWLVNKENKKSISDYLVQRGLRKIAIYGNGVLGTHLIKEIENSDVKIEYLIDRNYALKEGHYKVISPLDELPLVDLIIVTPINEYHKIRAELIKKTKAKIISLDEIIFEL